MYHKTVRRRTANSLHSFLWLCMHELLTNCGTLGNNIFIKLICSSHLFKVTVIKITFLLPESKEPQRNVSNSSPSLQSSSLSFLFLLVMLISWLAETETMEAFSGFESSSCVRAWKMGNHTNRGIDELKGKKKCVKRRRSTTFNVTEISRQDEAGGSPPATIAFFSRKSGLVITTMCVLRVCVRVL